MNMTSTWEIELNLSFWGLELLREFQENTERMSTNQQDFAKQLHRLTERLQH